MAKFHRSSAGSGLLPRGSKRWTWPLILLAVSVGLMLLPAAWTGRLMSLVQVLVPLQDAGRSVSEAMAGSLAGGEGDAPSDEFRRLQRQNQALSHQLAAACLRLREVEKENMILTATRYAGGDGTGIGSAGRLIPARIVAEDLLGWRTSRLINAGSLQGIRRGDAVTSHHFSIDIGESAGVRSGMAILMAETLVGTIEHTGSQTSRVKLLSDLQVEMKVRIGRFREGRFEAIDRYFWLVGRGGRVMEIGDVGKRDVENGIVQVGDVVLSDPLATALPAAMVIGTVKTIRPNPSKPLLVTLVVESPIELESLDRVFVHDPDGEL